MSELLDKQIYVQIEILKIIFWGSRKPTKKCVMKMKIIFWGSRKPTKKCVMKMKEKNDDRIIFLWWKEEFIRLYQKSGRTDFNELQDTVSILNKSTNSLVTSESEPDGWFAVRRHQTSTIKFAMASSQDW